MGDNCNFQNFLFIMENFKHIKIQTCKHKKSYNEPPYTHYPFSTIINYNCTHFSLYYFFPFICVEGIFLRYNLISLGQNSILEKYVMLTLKCNKLLNIIIYFLIEMLLFLVEHWNFPSFSFFNKKIIEICSKVEEE